MASEPPARPERRARVTRRLPSARVSAPERGRLREQLRDVEFPVALRGYERAAVDRYVEHASRLIAELEISASPEAAIRHALAEASEETRGMLERAHATAEEITARSRAKADERLQRGEREAEQLRAAAARETHALRATAQRETDSLRAEADRQARELDERARRAADQLHAAAARDAEQLRAAAEARARELEEDAAALVERRQRLLDELAELAGGLLELAHTDTPRAPAPHTSGTPAAGKGPISDGKPGEDAKHATSAAEPPAAARDDTTHN